MRHLDWGCMYDSPSNTWPPQQEAVYLIMRESVRDTQGASSRERCTKKTTTNSSSRYLTTHTHTHASCLPFPTANHMRGREIIIFSVKLNRWWQLRKKNKNKTTDANVPVCFFFCKHQLSSQRRFHWSSNFVVPGSYPWIKPWSFDWRLITLPLTQTTTLENRGKAGGIKLSFVFELGWDKEGPGNWGGKYLHAFLANCADFYVL